MPRKKSARLGLEDKVTLELRDYTLVQGSFDKIASIGMFEQVGEANHRSLLPERQPLAETGRLISSSFDRAARAGL